METLKKLTKEQCAIIYIDGKTPKIYRIMFIDDAIKGIVTDRLAGTNSTIPSQKANWGVFTADRSEAELMWYIVFGSAKEDASWIGHSPLPHFHTEPHKIIINGVETTPHAWFLTYE